MATRRKRTSERPPSNTSAGRVAILLEQIQEQNRATIEAVRSVESSLRREITELRRDLTLRMEALEIAVRKNSEDIRELQQQVRKNSEDIRELQQQVRKNSEDIRELQQQVRTNSEDTRELQQQVRKNSEDIRELQKEVAESKELIRGKPDEAGLGALEVRVAKLEQRVGL
jgi:chromosome segregation ATPase